MFTNVVGWWKIMYGGGIGTFVYSALAGIDTILNGTVAGWSRLIFKPEPAAIRKLGHAAATHTTRYGNASINWEMTKSSFEMTVTIPTGATGEAYFPMLSEIGGATLTIVDIAAGKDIWKAGAFVTGVAGVRGATLSTPLAYGPDKGLKSVVVDLGSGTYPFRISA